MTKTFAFATKKKGNGYERREDDEYPGYARIIEEVTNRHSAIQFFQLVLMTIVPFNLRVDSVK
jgi:hypothetical protein